MATSYFRYDSWTKTAQGPAVPGAQIYVCTQPANVNSAPPSPLASIYSDPNGLVPVTQPLIADGFGHVDFYALAGVYTIVVALGGIIQQVYPDQSLGGVGSGGGTGITFQANGMALPNQTLLNLYSSDDSVTVTPDVNGDGGINLQAKTSAFGSTGYGGFWSAGFDLNRFATATMSTAAPEVTANNQVLVWQFVLESSWTISNVTAYVESAGSSGSLVTFGIYSADGNTKILDSGAIPATTATTIITTTIEPVTIPAGTYFFAAGDARVNGPAPTLLTWTAIAGNNALGVNIINNYATRVAIAANPISAEGALPSTLGALTPLSNNNVQAMMAVFFGV
jgi:hypothetical protein